MRIKYIALVLTCIICMSLLYSCKNEGVDLPELGIEDENLNNQIQLIKVDRYNSYKYGDTLTFFLKNSSDECINLGVYYNLTIFALDGDKWVEVKDNMETITTSDVIVDSKSEIRAIYTEPNIPFSSNNYKILTFVSGTLLDSGIKVGAYEFFTLKN